jgi:hypothetical protein
MSDHDPPLYITTPQAFGQLRPLVLKRDEQVLVGTVR